MSQKIINFISFITIILFQVSFQYENITKNKIKTFRNLFKSLNQSKTEIKSEKLLKMRNLLDIEDINEDTSDRSNLIPSLLFELFDSFAYFLYFQGLTDLLYREEVETCLFDGILENINNQPLLDIYIDGSGKSLNDFGNEYVCDYNIRRNVSYITLHFHIATDHYLSDKEKFFGQNYFYIGLCLPRKCTNATKYLIQEQRVLNICQEVGLSNFKLYMNEDVVYMSSKLSGFYSVLIFVYFILNLIKFLIGILRVIFLNKGYKGFVSDMSRNIIERKESLKSRKTKNEEINLNDVIPDDIENDSDNKDFSFISAKENDKYPDLSSFYNSDINEIILSEGENLYNPFEDKEKNLPNYLKILKLFDLFDNLKILSNNSNKYYNSKGIRSLYIIRFFLMLMCVIHQIMYTQIYLPSKNFYNFEFYSHVLFIFVKLCINASTFWITLDAAIFGYKLMSYLKKEIKLSKNFEINYLTFLKFLLLIIPKFFVFLFAFILLHLNASKLTFELCKGNNVFSNYLYYNDTVQQMSYSLRNNKNVGDFFKNFIPFRLNYIDYIENITIEKREYNPEIIQNFTSDTSGYEIPSPFLTNTDLFVNVYLNEFYLIILMLIITYASYKLKNNIFDFAILIINVILFILPAIEVLHPFKGNIEEQNYTLKYILGQNYTEKYTHFFINFFYFGFLIGVMKFYHEQNIYNMKKNKNILSQIGLPFEFCRKVITYINGINFKLKRTILFICIFFLLLISSSFTLSEAKYISNFETIDFLKITKLIKFLFFYEKNLSGIFFFIFLLMYICYKKDTYIMKIAKSTTFIIVERISFCFYTSFSYLIYAQFCVFLISIQMSYSNLFFNTIGMFFITFIFSLMNTTLLELPIRQLIKYCMNRNLEKKFNDFFYEHYLCSIGINTDDSSSSYTGK